MSLSFISPFASRIVSILPLLSFLEEGGIFSQALSGGVLLLSAALIRRRRRGLIGGSLGTAIVLLAGAMALAEVSGMASGETEAVGWPFALVIALLALYALDLVMLGIGGVMLLRDRSLPIP